MATAHELTVKNNGRNVLLKFTDADLIVDYGGGIMDDEHSSQCSSVSCFSGFCRTHNTRLDQVPFRQVIGAYYAKGSLKVSYLTRNHKKNFVLCKCEGAVEEEHNTFAMDWADKLMDAAYKGAKQSKTLKVLVNPRGGIGKAKSIFTDQVEPVFLAAGCTLDITYTEYINHACEIAQELKLKYDAVVTVSGDGLIHEVLNGFAQHEQPGKAFAIPIAPIPAGSGNALSLNLLGIEDGLDSLAAALNVLKGHPMKADLFSFIQNDKRRISFMSQSIGLVADLDIGTDHLRWMGDSRFLYGYLRGVLSLKTCPVELSFRLVEDDKEKMARFAQENTGQKPCDPSSSGVDDLEELPPLRYLGGTEEGWTTYEKPFIWIYAGKGPYVSRSLMQFPVSLPDDGLIDIAVKEVVSLYSFILLNSCLKMVKDNRAKLLKALDGAEDGVPYWSTTNRYFKVSAYRIKPLASKGILAVDGEKFPYTDFQVEVHQRLGTFLSQYGRYMVNFKVQEPKQVLK
ncbi:hypothetical protein SERLA73DRAFT_185417 [Serpula lacrymans var. lacrymans S7.3]|uniref:DAGKc domain-containing protein n=2 Tax=Serpula lacrymans var. lacrymans TaxID=341189 RepID=F8Q5S6_SERL3|nr:uncharacterized protein SERLADRAFT_473900 [Serpula lacrymans var. lacrymans S7.9]EGN95964.1 hypothetical protein SERLA73DRAFT_185417 [Serpula lacrymans var. lacrymans S7.3]EGO21489.1 hypothetical protein SERLADRAFT_473900 [Serpula lacrymans var. lacrymans S7.9]